VSYRKELLTSFLPGKGTSLPLRQREIKKGQVPAKGGTLRGASGGKKEGQTSLSKTSREAHLIGEGKDLFVESH